MRFSAMYASSPDDSRRIGTGWTFGTFGRVGAYSCPHAIYGRWERIATRIVGITTVRGLRVYAGCTSIVQIADTNLHAHWKERLRLRLLHADLLPSVWQHIDSTSDSDSDEVGRLRDLVATQ